MQRIMALVLITTMSLPGGVLADEATPASSRETGPTLGERIHNMDAEVSRFLILHPVAPEGLLCEQDTPATDESSVAVKVKLFSLKPGTRVGVILQDGHKVQGQLAEVRDDAFFLSIEIEEGRYRRTRYSFDQVVSLEYPRQPEKVGEIPIDKRIEVVLLNGEKIRGRLSAVANQSFTLNLGKDESREFIFDDVVSVRELGMRTVYKVLIAAGVVFGALLGIAAGLYAAYG